MRMNLSPLPGTPRAILPWCWAVLAGMALSLGACSSRDQLFPELEPKAFVSPSSSMAWEPSHNVGYEPARMAPVGGRPGESVTLSGRQSLMQLVALALEINPQTRAAWENARAAAARYGSVRGLWYPTFGVSAGLSLDNVLFPVGDESVIDIQMFSVVPMAELNYILLDFGRRSSADAQARYTLWVANLDFNRRIQETIYEVQKTYFDLDAANGLYDAALRELELAITVVDAVEDRLSVGLATAPELLFARQELAQAEFDVQARIAGIDDAKSALLVSIGLPAIIPIEIESLTALPLPEQLEIKVDEAIRLALQDRPDLAGAVAKLRAAEAGVNAAEAEFYPTVSFNGNVGWEQFLSHTSKDRGDPDTVQYGSVIYDVGITGSWILFEGFSLRNNLREARALRRQAQAELETLRIQTIGEVWDSYNDYLAAQRQYEFGIALVESSRESYDAILASYEVGLATIQELVASEKDLAAALATLVETRAFLLTSSARVSYAIGAGIGETPKSSSRSAGESNQVIAQ